jgi:precorrin-2 dehydrogenase/sirohydrochlorin ferrochelatase
MTKVTPLYPINLKISGHLCLVIGGGTVALRKVRGLLQCGAKVRVVSEQAHKELQQLAQHGRIEWFARDFAEGDLRGAFLAYAATDNRQVQLQIEAEAERSRVLLNSIDDPQASNFHVPAHFRRGRMLVSVSTGGASPALAKKLRQQLEGIFPPAYDAVTELLAIIREKVVGDDGDIDAHTALFHRLLDHGFVEIVLRQDWFEVQMLLLRELPRGIDGVEIIKRFLAKHDSESL